jgi:hypothetical protein
MKDHKPRLGDLDLQVAFRLSGNETIYRTINYPPSLANPAMGMRDCLNLTTLQADRLACRLKIVLIPLYSEVSESKE